MQKNVYIWQGAEKFSVQPRRDSKIKCFVIWSDFREIDQVKNFSAPPYIYMHIDRQVRTHTHTCIHYFAYLNMSIYLSDKIFFFLLNYKNNFYESVVGFENNLFCDFFFLDSWLSFDNITTTYSFMGVQMAFHSWQNGEINEFSSLDNSDHNTGSKTKDKISLSSYSQPWLDIHHKFTP